MRETKKPFAYVAFFAVCLTFGTSYAVISQALKRVDGSTLSCLRMWVACFCAFTALGIQLLTNRKFRSSFFHSVETRTLPFAQMLFCGIANYGFPHSLITLAQRSVSSVMVTMAQPCVPLFSLFAAHFLIPEEPFTCAKLVPNILALAGTLLTALPSWTSTHSSHPLDYLLLALAIASFGFGSVYIKTINADAIVCCSFQLLGSAIYTTLFAGAHITRVSPEGLLWSFIIGFTYTFMSSLLFIYVVRELGPIKAGFANFGQIIIGTISGVLVLHEWASYSRSDTAISIAGLILLTLSLALGFRKPAPKLPNLPLL